MVLRRVEVVGHWGRFVPLLFRRFVICALQLLELRDDVRFDSRPVYAYTIDYASAKDSPTYRRCVLYIDKQLMLPVYVRNWTWSKNADGGESGKFDDSTLEEYYAYRKINAEAELKQIDFARENSSYNFN